MPLLGHAVTDMGIQADLMKITAYKKLHSVVLTQRLFVTLRSKLHQPVVWQQCVHMRTHSGALYTFRPPGVGLGQVGYSVAVHAFFFATMLSVTTVACVSRCVSPDLVLTASTFTMVAMIHQAALSSGKTRDTC